jgi:ribonuclease R
MTRKRKQDPEKTTPNPQSPNSKKRRRGPRRTTPTPVTEQPAPALLPREEPVKAAENPESSARRRRVRAPRNRPATASTTARATEGAQQSARPAHVGARTKRGTVDMHFRGYAFVHTPGGEKIRISENMTSGILDGDTVDVTFAANTPKRVSLVSRGRGRVVADVIGKRTRTGNFPVQVDRALGDLSVEVHGRHIAGHALIIDLTCDPAMIVEDLGLALESNASARRFLSRHHLDALDTAPPVTAPAPLPATPALSVPRRELRTQHVITIDESSAFALDDALSAQPPDDEGYVRVWVHIADAAESVQPGTPLDELARSVPSSIYLPRHVRHMLPASLTTAELSLLPDCDRNAVTVELRISPDGTIVSRDVYESLIRSHARLTYDKVESFLTSRSAKLPGSLAATREVLRALHVASTRLHTKLTTRGRVELLRDEESSAGYGDAPVAHALVEQLMIAANEAIAHWARERGVRLLYRSQETLSANQCAELSHVMNSAGLPASVTYPLSAQDLSALTSLATQSALSEVLRDATYRLQPRPSYSVNSYSHFSLAAPAYTHATAPIRRYADLVNQRIVKAHLRAELPPHEPTELADLARRVNTAAAAVSSATRDASAFAALREVKVGDVREATVIRSSASGVRVRVNGVRNVTLPLDAPASKARLGQRVKVCVVAVDALRGTAEVVPAV